MHTTQQSCWFHLRQSNCPIAYLRTASAVNTHCYTPCTPGTGLMISSLVLLSANDGSDASSTLITGACKPFFSLSQVVTVES